MCSPRTRLCPNLESPIKYVYESWSCGGSSEIQGPWFSEQHSETHKETYLWSRPCLLGSFQLYLHSWWRQHRWGFSLHHLETHTENKFRKCLRIWKFSKPQEGTQNIKNQVTDTEDTGNERRKNRCKLSKIWNMNVEANSGWLITHATLENIVMSIAFKRWRTNVRGEELLKIMVPTGLYFVQHLEIIGNPWKNQVNLSRGEEQASYCRNKEINGRNVSEENLSRLSYSTKQTIWNTFKTSLLPVLKVIWMVVQNFKNNTGG